LSNYEKLSKLTDFRGIRKIKEKFFRYKHHPIAAKGISTPIQNIKTLRAAYKSIYAAAWILKPPKSKKRKAKTYA